jgi:hypothetical protein
MLRAIGVIMLIGIAAMHFLQLVATFEATPMLGAAYVAFIAACLIVAARLITTGDGAAWLMAGGICAAAVAGYAFTRVLSTPFDNQDVGNWACMLGLAALFIESLVLVLGAYALAGDPAARPADGTAMIAMSPSASAPAMRLRTDSTGAVR